MAACKRGSNMLMPALDGAAAGVCAGGQQISCASCCCDKRLVAVTDA